MIEVAAPVKKSGKKDLRLYVDFTVNGKKERLWYQFPEIYEEYLDTDRSDGFLIGLLFLALKNGCDLKIHAKVSEKLVYNLKHSLIPALCFANKGFHPIQIIASEVSSEDINNTNATGTGMSCGVDSFATYFQHMEENGSFNIDYLTYFNVGSHGDFGGDKSRNIFTDRLKHAVDFAKEVDLPLLYIDSNLSEVLRLNFQSTHTLRSLSCILHLQKLFKRYYYSSTYRYDHFKMSGKDTAYYDLLILPLLSTESTTFYSSLIDMTRVERTTFITDFSSTYKLLDVCTQPWEGIKLNCSKCHKCLRTLLTLDLIGELENYQEVFDLDVYGKHKEKFIGEVIATKRQDIFNKEIFDLLKKNKKIGLPQYQNVYNYLTTRAINNLKKEVKSRLR